MKNESHFLKKTHLYYATFNALKILLSIGIFLEREDTLAAETKSPMQTFAVSDISSLSFLFLLTEHTINRILNNLVFYRSTTM